MSRIGPALIACMALLFTIATFWWNNWRRGRLHVDPPRSYAAYNGQNRQILVFPLAIRNSGPRLISIIALRLIAPNGNLYEHENVRFGLLDLKDNEFAANFSVPGRGIDITFRQFSSDTELWPFEAGTHRFELTALTGDKKGWHKIGSFDVEFENEYIVQMEKRFLSYRNKAALR